MMLKKSVFDLVGGFDEKLSDAHYIGIDFCIRVGATGLEIVNEVYVVQIMDKLIVSEENKQYMAEKWDEVLKLGDPYYNPNFKKDGSFSYDM